MTNNTFEIIGGKPLKGEFVPQGAKNEALEIIAAVLLSPEKITITNIPNVLDCNNLITLLQALGVKVANPEKGTFIFEADDVDLDYMYSDAFRAKAGKLRGSVLITGPLLGRFGKAFLTRPGGDKIGRRRLDTHFLGMEMLGAKFSYDEAKGAFSIEAKHLKGTHILLEEPSVTGTANVIMTAVLAEGTTTIYHAACEPYTQQLCKMLNRMGARIEGIGSNLLTINGVEKLGGCEHRILPDMLEIGSMMGLSAITKSEITIKNVAYKELGIIPRAFRKLGIEFELVNGDDIYLPPQDSYEIQTFIDGSILTISDHPWPGLTPDLLSVLLVVATQAKGSLLIHQKMFESRLFFVDKLIDMGAQVILCDPHRAVVIGHDRKFPLRGLRMSSPDIRAGVALLMAALSAKGKSVISNIHQIDRGYQDFDVRLQALGAQIERV